MQHKEATGIGKLRPTTEQVGRGRDVMEVLGVDIGGGNVVFCFVREGCSEGEGEAGQLRLR